MLVQVLLERMGNSKICISSKVRKFKITTTNFLIEYLLSCYKKFNYLLKIGDNYVAFFLKKKIDFFSFFKMFFIIFFKFKMGNKLCDCNNFLQNQKKFETNMVFFIF